MLNSKIFAQHILEKIALSPAFAQRAISNRVSKIMANRMSVVKSYGGRDGSGLLQQLEKLPSEKQLLSKYPRAVQASGASARMSAAQSIAKPYSPGIATAVPSNDLRLGMSEVARRQAVAAGRNPPVVNQTVNLRTPAVRGNVNTPFTRAPTESMANIGRKIMPARPVPIPRRMPPNYPGVGKAASVDNSYGYDPSYDARFKEDNTNTHPSLILGGLAGGTSGLTSGMLHYHGADLLETKPAVNPELISKLESKGLMAGGKFKNKLLYAGKHGLIAGGIGAGLGAAAGGLMHHYYNTKTASIVHQVIVKLARGPMPGQMSSAVPTNPYNPYAGAPVGPSHFGGGIAPSAAPPPVPQQALSPGARVHPQLSRLDVMMDGGAMPAQSAAPARMQVPEGALKPRNTASFLDAAAPTPAAAAAPSAKPAGSFSKALWKHKGKLGIGLGLGLGAIAASRGAFSSEPRGMYQPGQPMPKYSSKTAAITHQAIANMLRA